MDNVWTTVDKHCCLVPENRKLVCDIYGFTTIIITNQHKTYRHLPNTHHTHTSYSPPANCLLTRQPATQAANQDNQASKPSQPSQASHSQQASKPARPLINHSRSNQLVINQLVINQLLDNVARLARYVPGLFALLIQPASLLIKAS